MVKDMIQMKNCSFCIISLSKEHFFKNWLQIMKGNTPLQPADHLWAQSFPWQLHNTQKCIIVIFWHRHLVVVSGDRPLRLRIVLTFPTSDVFSILSACSSDASIALANSLSCARVSVDSRSKRRRKRCERQLITIWSRMRSSLSANWQVAARVRSRTV